MAPASVSWRERLNFATQLEKEMQKKSLNSITRRLIPNVSNFRVSDITVNASALLFGILKKYRRFNAEHFRRIEKSNRYLTKSYTRLISYASKGEFKKFENLSLTLIRSSRSYQIAMICHASKEWYAKSPKKVLRLFRQVSYLKDELEIRFERFWIDKKPGDRARPIGAPNLQWKVNMLKYLQIFELFYLTTGLYPRWQHAGTGGRGLTTCWREVLNILEKYAYVYEFDIKGFFDNISNQNSVPELPTINSRLNEMVNSKPIAWNVPADEEQEVDMNTFFRLVGVRGLMELKHVENEDGSVTFDLMSAKGTVYENAMSYLAQVRDMNKGLGFKNHGYPQGANFSPFLSCLTLARALGNIKGVLMYMDDGLIYGYSKQQLSARISLFKKKILDIGLELSEEKSRMVKDQSGFHGLKFLGIKLEDDWAMTSSTRKGTIKPIDLAEKMLSREEFQTFVSQINADKGRVDVVYSTLSRKTVPEQLPTPPQPFITVPEVKYEDLVRGFLLERTIGEEGDNMKNSERRVQRWVATKSTNAFEAAKWAAEQGFLSVEIAKAMDPSQDPSELRERIEKLQAKYPNSPLAELMLRYSVDKDDPRLSRQLIGELEKVRKLGKIGTLSREIIERQKDTNTLFPDIQIISSKAVLWLMKKLRRKDKRRRRSKK